MQVTTGVIYRGDLLQRSEDMEILSVGCGSVYDKDYHFCREPVSGEYMLLLTRSRADIGFDGIRGSFPENTLMIYDDKMKRDHRGEDASLICDWVCFTAGNDNGLSEFPELVFNRPFRAADAEFISGLIRNIASEFYSLGSRRTKMLDSLMRMLLIKAGDCIGRKDTSQQSADPHYSSLIELRAKIYRNPQLKWNVDTMAADVNMSRSYLQHIYREIFGVSCISDVISSKIEKAKELLTESSCTVSQVAFMCGYDNEEHFMRQFKKIVGVTPTRYRKNK